MIFRIPTLIVAAAILALAPIAQATELDGVTAGCSPGTTIDDIIWGTGGGDDDGVPGIARLRVSF